MDKTYFKKQSLSEASQHQRYYKSISTEERASAFFLMMQTAYNFVGKDWPKMQKEFTGKRRISD